MKCLAGIGNIVCWGAGNKSSQHTGERTVQGNVVQNPDGSQVQASEIQILGTVDGVPVV